MKTIFFTLLKYVHSAFLGEEVNVGILLCFPEQGRMEFRVSQVSRRLRLLYPNVNEVLLDKYLLSIKKRVTRANNEAEVYTTVDEFTEFISRKLLIRDASVLQFSAVRQALTQSSPVAVVVDYYFSLFFPEVKSPVASAVKPRRDDVFLRKQFSMLISKKDPTVLKLLEKNVRLTAGTASVKFDYGWQNGAHNLVKALSFDLADKEEIDRKSFYFCGWLEVFAEEAKEQHYRFDLLIARPADSKLYKNYENALRLLEKSAAPKRLITESELEKYSSQAVVALQEHRTKE